MSIQNQYNECIKICDSEVINVRDPKCDHKECFEAGYRSCLADIMKKYSTKIFISEKTGYPQGYVILYPYINLDE
jgi:hypothetical protein